MFCSLRCAGAPIPLAFRSHKPLRASRAPRHHQVSCALNDPWATLGVSRTASEQEIKKAHRKLVLQSHPDLKGDDPLAHARFMRIQEAYELIVGKRQGKDIDGRPADKSGWQFHDWYWKFSMKRRKGKGPVGAAMGDDEPPPGSLRQQWQAQMAGLKQKAAAKRYRQQWQRQERGAARGQAGTGAASGAARAARESVWRSTTKNARATHTAAAAQQPAAASPALDRKRPAAVAADSRQQHVAVAALGHEPLRHSVADSPDTEPDHVVAAAHAPTTKQQPPARADEEQEHVAHTAGAAHHDRPASSSHIERLRQLLEHAVTLVQPSSKPSQAGASQTQAGGRHMRGRLNLQQLAALLGGHGSSHHTTQQEHGAAAAHHATTPNGASSAVPADQHLRERLEASMRRHHVAQEQCGRQESATDTAAAAAAAADSSSPDDEREDVRRRYRHYRPTAHAAKFADRDEVEGRLSSQLAGLKRRAALKHEVETNC